MISARLVLAVASLLFISDAAPAPTATVSCEDSEDDLCTHISAAHSGNVAAMLLLTGDLDGTASAELSEVNGLLLKLLNENTTLESLFEVLKQALEKELSALATLNTACPTTENSVRCAISCDDVKFAAKEIMLAIMEAETNDDKKKEIQAMVEKLPVSQTKGTDTCDRDSYVHSKGKLVLDSIKKNRT
ncbi:hypothetical protein Q1695_004315 [Nippostrongylus brasiliensis]|nr:hypothetical protein Q1695_004315 [Nippostrongylus brasiliensis]